MAAWRCKGGCDSCEKVLRAHRCEKRVIGSKHRGLEECIDETEKLKKTKAKTTLL